MKQIILGLTFLLTIPCVYSQSKSEWAYKGKMNWNDAKTMCESLGMSLPKEHQLRNYLRDPEIKNVSYWTNKEMSATTAYCVFANGNSYPESKDNNKVHTVCVP
jgi:hypothetical protein